MEDYIREKTHKGRDKNDREDNVSRYKGLPSRNLSVAIREYAPGAEIILDGRVFRSAGVSLHWHNLNADTNEAQRLDSAWRCHKCGTLGYEEGIGGSGIYSVPIARAGSGSHWITGVRYYSPPVLSPMPILPLRTTLKQ